MKLKLTNYAWDIETKDKKDIQMSSIVDLDSILMFIPKYALGFGYRKPVLANDGSDLNDPTPTGARGARGGIMNLYDTAFSGYAALPVGYIAVMKNGNYVPFTDFETPYNSDKWSVYDNLSLEDTKQWMEIQKEQTHIDHSVLDSITDSIDLETKYYAMYQKPYTQSVVEVLDMGLDHIQRKINDLQDEFLILVKTDEPAQHDSARKTFKYLANFNTIINVTRASTYQPDYTTSTNQIEQPYIPGFVFDYTCDSDVMKALQRITGQSVSQGADNMSLDGKEFSEVTFPAPYFTYNKSSDIVEYRAGNLFHNAAEYYKHFTNRFKY
jgi:hypothetical protein